MCQTCTSLILLKRKKIISHRTSQMIIGGIDSRFSERESQSTAPYGVVNAKEDGNWGLQPSF